MGWIWGVVLRILLDSDFFWAEKVVTQKARQPDSLSRISIWSFFLKKTSTVCASTSIFIDLILELHRWTYVHISFIVASIYLPDAHNIWHFGMTQMLPIQGNLVGFWISVQCMKGYLVVQDRSAIVGPYTCCEVSGPGYTHLPLGWSTSGLLTLIFPF